MIKYTGTQVVFEEIPDEITLAINISNCPHHCPGCHSPYLRENIGEELYGDMLVDMIEKNDGITCVLFMGEGKDEDALFKMIDVIRHFYGSRIKIGLYTGSENVSPFLWENLDYIKLGPYNERKGPLNNPKTNQRLYRKSYGKWEDITYRFWRKGTE